MSTCALHMHSCACVRSSHILHTYTEKKTHSGLSLLIGRRIKSVSEVEGLFPKCSLKKDPGFLGATGTFPLQMFQKILKLFKLGNSTNEGARSLRNPHPGQHVFSRSPFDLSTQRRRLSDLTQCD